jgi:2-phospho-L-lactate guanylyltransferase
MILVPVKNLTNAKQRLSSALAPEARQELAQAMCADVLETLSRWQRRLAVTVVTSDPFAGYLATRLGATFWPMRIIQERQELSKWRPRAGGRVFITRWHPADIPRWRLSNSIAFVIGPSTGTVLVLGCRRGHQRGVAFSGDLFPASFWHDSFLPHLLRQRQPRTVRRASNWRNCAG